jgi:cyclic pyranopterin monophosphate synthase
MSGLTHLGAAGEANMVDVSTKQATERVAVAEGRVVMKASTLDLVVKGDAKKGDVIGTARIAGIMAAKRTPDLVPLCHPVALHGVTVDLEVVDDGVRITATTRTADRTGVEMEALTAVAAAGLALVDMVKAVDRAASITDVRVEAKSGGRSGTWERSA